MSRSKMVRVSTFLAALVMMLSIGLHPSTEMEIELCFSYNRWLTEHVLPEADGRLYSMLSLPISDPDEALRQVEKFGHCKNVTGFLVTSARTAPILTSRRWISSTA